MAPMALLSARRLWRAALVAAVVLLATGGLIGAVDASSGSGTSFVLPTVHLGDVARYHETSTDDEKTDESNVMVAWGTRDPVVMPDGQWQPLETLTETLQMHDENAFPGTGMGFSIEVGYAPATAQAKTIGVTGNFSGAMSRDDLLPVPLVKETTSLEGGIQMLLFMPDLSGMPFDTPECLFGGALDGQTLSDSQPLVLPRFCLPLIAQAMPGMALDARGVDTVDGVRALHYRGTSSTPMPEIPAVTVDLWMTPLSPYPLRVQVEDPSDGKTETLQMTGFQAGLVERTPAPTTPALGKPDLRLSPGTALLPFAEDGVTHPFPLSRAVAAARTSDTTVQSFLASHPEAYVVQAAYNEFAYTSMTRYTWDFTLGQPGAALDVSVSQDLPTTLSGLPAPVLDALAVPPSTSVQTSDSQTMPTVPRSDVPPLPTISSLFEQWGWQRPGQTGAQCWSYDLTGKDGDLLDGGGFTSAGRCRDSIDAGADPQPAVVATGRLDMDMALFDLNGTTRGLMVFQGTERDAASATALPPSAAPASAALAQTVPGHWLPTPGQAAGAGLLALLAGALYYAWPAIKGGPLLGLFTRLHGPKLLEHPGRQRLVELVESEPGVHFQDLVRRSGMPNGTAMHHLGKLTKAGLLSARPLGRYTCYFPGSSVDRIALVQAPILRSDGARLVYGLIQANPGLSGLELAGRAGLQPSTVNYHVQRLVECGLVASVRDGRSVRLRAASA